MAAMRRLILTLTVMGLIGGADQAFAQGTEGSGIGVGVQTTLTGYGEDLFGTRDLTGPALVYQTPKFHIDGIVAFLSVNDSTQIAAAGRFWYALHSTPASDLSLGGGLGFVNYEVGDGSETDIHLELGAKIRAFVVPSVAFNASLGLALVLGEQDTTSLIGQLMGGRRTNLFLLLARSVDALAAFPAVKALAGLFAQLALGNPLPEALGWGKSSAQGALEILGDGQAHIQANQVGQLQRPHGMTVAQLHGGIDVGGRRHTFFNHSHGFEAQGDAQATRGKSGSVADKYGRLAHGLGHRLNLLDGLLPGALVMNHLAQLHAMNRVEKVHADDQARIGQPTGNVGQ